MRLLLTLLLALKLTAAAQDFDGLELVQLVGTLELPREQAIQVLVLKNSGGFPLIGLYFSDPAGELRLYLNRRGWEQLARLQPFMREGFPQVTPAELDQVGNLRGYQIKTDPPNLKVNLISESPLVERQLVATVSLPGKRLVFPLSQGKAAELAGLLAQARQLASSP